MRTLRLGLVGCATAVVAWAAAAGPARADFTETFCTNGGPAAPWTEGVGGPAGFIREIDGCSAGGVDAFQISGNTTLGAGAEESMGITMPPGEVLTGAQVNYGTSPSTTTGSELLIGDDGVAVVDAAMGNEYSGNHLSATFAGAHDLTFSVYCSEPTASAPPCDYGTATPLGVAQATLTIHDTGAPTVAATGGGLVGGGTRGGLQSLGYTASDVGSGVAKVTASLGTTVVGSAASTCVAPSLTPCPGTVNGAMVIDTALVANGTYPVTLTAYDASGDPTSVAVSTVRVRNTGTVAVSPKRRRRHVSVRVTTGWHWYRRSSRLTSLRFRGLAASATVSWRCRGRRCPRHRRPWMIGGRRVAVLERRLAGTSYAAGDGISVTIARRHEVAERVGITIRGGRQPRLRLLG